MLMNMCLPNFDIYQGVVALMSSLKFTLSEVTLFVLNNLLGLKKLYSGCIVKVLISFSVWIPFGK